MFSFFSSTSSSQPNPEKKQKIFNEDELYEHRHDTKQCLVGLFGKVYDVRLFIPHHPGLEKSIRALQGQDISDLFTEADPNHKHLDAEKTLKLLERARCEEVGILLKKV